MYVYLSQNYSGERSYLAASSSPPFITVARDSFLRGVLFRLVHVGYADPPPQLPGQTWTVLAFERGGQRNGRGHPYLGRFW